MTNAAGVIGLTFDGYDLQRPDLNVMFEIVDGLDSLPIVRGGSQVIPFRSGRLPSPRYADHRAVVANGWVAGAAPAPETSYRAYLDGLKQVLAPTNTPRRLVATLPDGSRRWINARPANPALLGGDMVGYEMRPMSIEWEALDPYWYGQTGLSMDAGYFMDAGETLDSGEEIIVNPTAAAQEVEINSRGTAAVERVRVTFIGPTDTGFGVENLSTDELVGFAFLGTLAAPPTPATLVVDNDLRTVELNGLSIRSSMVLRDGNLHGEYLRLVPGVNRIRITGRPAECRIRFNPTYL